MMRRARAAHAEAGDRRARARREWKGAGGTPESGARRRQGAASSGSDLEKNLLSNLERAGSPDTREEATLALAEYYLDAARPLEALSLFEKVSRATSDRERRELSDYFLCRLDGKRIEDLAGGGNGGPYGEVLEQFFHLYLRMGNDAVAARYLRMIIDVTDDPDIEANCLLSLGEMSERAGDCAQAIAHYAAALRRPPGTGEAWYFLNRNMGRCLNACARYREAETYCRRAISIDPSRHCARETLGESLRGQGRCAEAARSLIAAAELQPSSPGALRALEELAGSCEELADELPDLARSLERCRKLSRSARIRYNQ